MKMKYIDGKNDIARLALAFYRFNRKKGMSPKESKDDYVKGILAAARHIGRMRNLLNNEYFEA